MFVLVTGGSGSGKSEFAENMAVSLGGDRTYIAAMIPSGRESARRIARHRKAREGKGFNTVERYTDIKNLDVSGTALLECMSNLAANEMFSDAGAGDNTADEILKGIDSLVQKCENLVVLTNEIFSDGIAYDDSTVKYMRALGKINRAMAQKADAVYEVVCSRANRIK